MEKHTPTAPFGRRSLKLAHVAAQMAAAARAPEKIVHKWKTFQAICSARARLGVSERSLSVLNALLTFHPETALSGGDDLIVFPSNRQLAHRAHGMPASTLRRHLSALVDAGLIVRRDSPNGKRYARKGAGGDIELAFGFDLSPLVARASEFERIAADVEADHRAVKLARERITLCRRDIAKMIAMAIDEQIPLRRTGQGWSDIHAAFRAIVEGIPRSATLIQFQTAAEELARLADDILNLLETYIKSRNPSANESHSGRHIQNSNTDHLVESEPASQKGGAASPEGDPQAQRMGEAIYPLGMVLNACPDIADYAKGGVANWRDFVATATVVRPMLGISPSAWLDAVETMGERHASIVIACILQRAAAIKSPGGYLRNLTERARAGEFSLGPILMAQINTKLREKCSA